MLVIKKESYLLSFFNSCADCNEVHTTPLTTQNALVFIMFRVLGYQIYKYNIDYKSVRNATSSTSAHIHSSTLEQKVRLGSDDVMYTRPEKSNTSMQNSPNKLYRLRFAFVFIKGEGYLGFQNQWGCLVQGEPHIHNLSRNFLIPKNFFAGN